MKEKKKWLFRLSRLNSENVKEIFEMNFFQWRIINSNEVIADGEKVEGKERELLLQPNENGNPNVENWISSNISKQGTPLTKQIFIDEQLKKYEHLYNDTIGSEINRDNNFRLKIYLDFLKNEKQMTFFQKGYYKMHPDLSELNHILPIEIYKEYKTKFNNVLIKKPEFGIIPFPDIEYKRIIDNKTDINEFPFVEYANGFLKGYNSDIEPYINTSEAKKEKILNICLFKIPKTFLEHHSERGIEYKSKELFEFGLHIGTKYKVWEIIIETPKVFLDVFKRLPPYREQTDEEIKQDKEYAKMIKEKGFLFALNNFIQSEKNKASSNEQSPPKTNENQKKKPGRPKAKRKTLIECIKNIEYKEKFIKALKNEFIDETTLGFVQMIKALKEMGYINYSARIQIYEAFETYFNKEFASRQAKDKSFNINDIKLTDSYKKRITDMKFKETII